MKMSLIGNNWQIADAVPSILNHDDRDFFERLRVGCQYRSKWLLNERYAGIVEAKKHNTGHRFTSLG